MGIEYLRPLFHSAHMRGALRFAQFLLYVFDIWYISMLIYYVVAIVQFSRIVHPLVFAVLVVFLVVVVACQVVIFPVVG